MNRTIANLLLILAFFGSVFLFIGWDAVSREAGNAWDATRETVSGWIPAFTRTKTVTVRGVEVRAEVADTEDARREGLMGRESLEEGTGMILRFPNAGYHGVWMKGMRFSLDIIWIRDGKVVWIVENAPPAPHEEATPKIYVPEAAAQDVLEVPAGFVAAHAIAVGDPVSI
jgi:hypothetical protein